ncbi:MAG: peptidoglycan editing factor PgeF [Gammaproteobacteria bacterium]
MIGRSGPPLPLHSPTSKPQLIAADWPAPQRVQAFAATRHGGTSRGPHDSLNFSYGVGDEPDLVTRNRRALADTLGVEREVEWLEQVHGARVYRMGRETKPETADAAWSDRAGELCVVTTADCLPVVLCNDGGTEIAAAHAGWRGLAAGVLEAAIAAFATPAPNLLAWMGPAIGAKVYEVGDEVRAAFVDGDAGAAQCFVPSPAGRWLADLYALARRRLGAAGVERVYGGEFCTYTEEDRFFSYRRAKVSGRMASGILMRG